MTNVTTSERGSSSRTPSIRVPVIGGTCCSVLLQTGAEAIASTNRRSPTPAYRLDGCTPYALEGSIFVAGAAVKWYDGICIIAHACDTGGIATQVTDSHGVYMVPAFVGLGAPHWDADARAAISGLTPGSTQARLARAALEAVGDQTHDLVEAMAAAGGMAAND